MTATMRELRCLGHRHKLSQVLSMVTRLARYEKFTEACTVVARVEVQTDTQLRELLLDTQEFWEFDAGRGVLTRACPMENDRVYFEIDVHELFVDDVWRLLRETEPVF